MNNKKPQDQIPQHLRKTAAQWVTKRELGFSANEQDEFNTWLTEDPLHKEAFVSANRSWDELDRLLGMQTSYHAKPDPDLFDENRGKWGVFQRHGWLRFAMPIAAIIVLMIGFFPIGKSLRFDPQIPYEGHNEIVFDRIEKMRLEDGSRVTLNRGASVETRYSENERLVRLHSGEAIFEVEKDASRPFIVEASGVRVRAVGTAFNVRLSGQQVDVTVTEGIVSLATHDDSNEQNEAEEPLPLLEKNHKASVSFHEGTAVVQFEELDPVLVEQEMMWKPVIINFDDVPLSQIVEEFNRRNIKQMVLVGSVAQDIRLTSYFWSDNVEGFLRLLEQKYGIQVVETEDNTLYLSTVLRVVKPS